VSLKDLTWSKHQTAERTVFARKLLRGIDVYDYACYLFQLAPIYLTLENYARNLGILQKLPGIDRADSIRTDLFELVGGDHDLEYVPSSLKYKDYLDTIANDHNKILAHLYVRHMGDLYGGQMISKVIPGSGLFYKFENRQELISNMRSLLSDDLADEANIAFEYAIAILEDLNNV
jgi:heme oxygenase (biliverdin-producing, ferredoxin)